MENNDNKLELLTKKIYEEGIEKAQNDAKEILDNANNKANSIIKEAENKANAILEKAQNDSAILRQKTETELSMSAKQAMASLKQQITTLISNNLVCNTENKKIMFILATELIVDNKNIIPLICEYSKTEVDEFCIICEDVTPNTKTDFLNGKSITFITKTKLYFDYFFKFSTYPNTDILNSTNLKPKFIDILKNFFTPNKSKQYFFCGLILIFSSIILPYHIYYIVFGSILLLFSIICKLMPAFV